MRCVCSAALAAFVGSASSASAAPAADAEARALVVGVTVDPKVPDFDAAAALVIVREVVATTAADVAIVETRDAAAIFRATQPTITIGVRVVAVPRGTTRVELRSVSVASTSGSGGKPQRIDATVDPADGLSRLRTVLGESVRRSIERLFPPRPSLPAADAPGGPRTVPSDVAVARPPEAPSPPPPVASVDVAIPPPSQPTWSSLQIGALGAAGVGALTLGLGVWQGAAANGAAGDYRTAQFQVDVFDAKDRAESAGGRANVLFVVAGIALVTGGALFLIDVFTEDVGVGGASEATSVGRVGGASP